jgi:hypothetical protein
MKLEFEFEIATKQAVTASVAIGTSAAVAIVVYVSPDSGTTGIITIAIIAVTALWQLRL